MNYFEWEAWLALRPCTTAWRAVINALYGYPMAEEERALYTRLSGGLEPTEVPITELIVIAARRGGKSEMAARVACYEAGEIPHGDHLAPGQTGWIKIIGPERKHAKETLSYAKGIAALAKAKRKYKTVTYDEHVRFENTGIAIGIDSCDAVSVRGSTNVMVILEERAFFPSAEKAIPESEILASVRPTLIAGKGVPPRKLLSITSAYVKEGMVYEADSEQWGKPDASTHILRGDIFDFRPSIDRDFLAREEKLDSVRYRREYLSEWQDSITEGWFSDYAINKSIDPERHSIPFEPGLTYYLGIDAATKRDKFAVAVACCRKGPIDEKTGDRKGRITQIVHVDCLDPVALGRELYPSECVHMVANVALRYGTRDVYIDQHASSFVKEELKRRGLRGHDLPWTGGNHDDTKYQRFVGVRDAMIEGTFRIPDLPELAAEFRGVRAKALSMGQMKLDGKHDDLVDACVLAATVAMRKPAGVPDKELTGWELHELDKKKKWSIPFGGGGRFW